MTGEALGDHDDLIGVVRDEPTHARENTSRRRVSAVGADDSLQVAAAKGDEQRHALRQREQAALTEMRVHQIIRSAPQGGTHLEPCAQIPTGTPRPAEGEDVETNSRAAQEPHLLLDEYSRVGMLRA